jgi:hypothetical protein
MDRAKLNDVELEYEVRGAGEPLLLIDMSSPTASCRCLQSRRSHAATS